MPLVESQADLDRYNEFVRNSKYAKPFQDTNWSKVKENWDHEFVYIEENDEIVGALSVLAIKNDNGKYFLYAPRGPVCDFKDYDLVDSLIKECNILTEKYDAFLLRIDPEVLFDEKAIHEYQKRGYDFRTYPTDTHTFTQPRHSMILEIGSRDEEEIFNGFSTSTRRNVRKGYKKDLYTVHSQDQNAIDTFYDLTKIMADRQDIGHRPKEYFERLVKNMNGQMFITYLDEQALSSSIVIPYNDKAYYIYAASSNEKRNLMPNYQMIWEGIKWAKENGYDYYDFGGVFSLDTDDGLYHIKEGFCGSEGIYNFIGELDVVYDREKYNEFLKK